MVIHEVAKNPDLVPGCVFRLRKAMVLLKLKKTERKIVFRVPAYNRAGL